MLLSKLKELVATYDKQKGLRRRLFGDDSHITFLKKYIYDKEKFILSSGDTDPFIGYFEFLTSASISGLEFSEYYLNSNSLSANIFKQWRDQPIQLLIQPLQMRYNIEPLLSQLNTPINLSLNGTNLLTEHLRTTQLNHSLLEIWLSEDRQLRLSQYTHSTFFRQDIIRPRPRHSSYHYYHAAPAA